MKYCIIEQDNDPANNLCFNIETEMDSLLAAMRARGIESLSVWYSPTDENSPDAYKTNGRVVIVREVHSLLKSAKGKVSAESYRRMFYMDRH